MKRDGIDAARATEKVAAQMPLRKKQQLADVVIDNSGSPEETKQQVCIISWLYHMNCHCGRNNVHYTPASVDVHQQAIKGQKPAQTLA